MLQQPAVAILHSEKLLPLISRKPYRFTRQCATLFLMGLLVLLTSANFFVYGSSGPTRDLSSKQVPGNPSGPDEKSPDNSVQISEEYMCESDAAGAAGNVPSVVYPFHAAEKLHVVHDEIISPPPRFA